MSETRRAYRVGLEGWIKNDLIALKLNLHILSKTWQESRGKARARCGALFNKVVTFCAFFVLAQGEVGRRGWP